MTDELLDLLGEVGSAFQGELQRLLGQSGLGLAPFEARVLAIVARLPGCSQQRIAEATGRDKAQVARTVKELEARGLVTRQAHATEWRAQTVGLTSDGQRIYEAIQTQRSTLGTDLLTEARPEDKAAATRILTLLRAGLKDRSQNRDRA